MKHISLVNSTTGTLEESINAQQLQAAMAGCIDPVAHLGSLLLLQQLGLLQLPQLLLLILGALQPLVLLLRLLLQIPLPLLLLKVMQHAC